MNQNNKINNKNKKYVIIILVLFIVITMVILLNNILINFNKNDNNSINNIDKIYEELPKLETIDYNKTPLLYDFVNSSIGYHFSLEDDKTMTKMGSYYVLFYNNKNIKDTKTIYIEYYTFGEKITRPILGSKPYKTILTNDQIDNILSKIDEIKNYGKYTEENNYSVIFISRYIYDIESNYSNINSEQFTNIICCDEIGRWNGIDFNNYSYSEHGLMYENIYNNGLGWPTDWLIKDGWYDIMLKNGYDMNNDFWKRYNIESFKIYKSDKTTSPNKELKIYVEQLNRFKFRYNDNDIWIRVNEDQLKEVLRTYGYY